MAWMLAAHACAKSVLISAAGRLLAACASQVEGSLGYHGSSRYRYEVNSKAQQALIEDFPRGQTCYGSRSQPGRKNRELDGCSHADQAASPRIVGVRQPGCYANQGRYREAGQPGFEALETNRTTSECRDDQASGEGEQRAYRNSGEPAEDQSAITTPQTEADGEHFCEKGQKQR